jgi:hypothetical protein
MSGSTHAAPVGHVVAAGFAPTGNLVSREPEARAVSVGAQVRVTPVGHAVEVGARAGGETHTRGCLISALTHAAPVGRVVAGGFAQAAIAAPPSTSRRRQRRRTGVPLKMTRPGGAITDHAS